MFTVKRIARWSRVSEMSDSRIRFNPGFSESYKIEVLRSSEVSNSSRMRRVKERMNVKST